MQNQFDIKQGRNMKSNVDPDWGERRAMEMQANRANLSARGQFSGLKLYPYCFPSIYHLHSRHDATNIKFIKRLYRYQTASLPNYIITKLHHYQTTSLPNYIITKLYLFFLCYPSFDVIITKLYLF